MPLNDPQLDDRDFQEIYADLRLQIPRYAPEWTNFNDSDPGVTLLQLFAYLSEAMLFRMNQVPLKNYIKFLKLLGQELQPANPATAHLTFLPKADSIVQPVAERTQISAQAQDGGTALIFETERGLDLIPYLLTDLGVFDGANFVPVGDANSVPGTGFRPFSWSADPGNSLYFGFTPPKVLPAAGKRVFPQEMTFRVFLPASQTAGQPQQATGVTTPAKPPVGLVWEYRQKDGDKNWTRLNTLQDETAAFTHEGYMRIQGPVDIQPSTELRLNAKPRYWIRVRLDSGSYPGKIAPQIDFLRPNTVDAVNLSTYRNEILGYTEGHPSEIFQIRNKPLQALSIQLQVGSTTTTWTQVPDFLSSKPVDQVYVLNATAGTIQFGDGGHGAIPVASSAVIATEYRSGGGARGNQATAGTISSPVTNLVGVDKVTNERDATGGGDEQTLDDLLVTGPTMLRRGGRAVTPEDFGAIAKASGPIAAATALPLRHPDHPGVQVPGAITVVIVPQVGDVPPKPSADLIQAVCTALDGLAC